MSGQEILFVKKIISLIEDLSTSAGLEPNQHFVAKKIDSKYSGDLKSIVVCRDWARDVISDSFA